MFSTVRWDHTMVKVILKCFWLFNVNCHWKLLFGIIMIIDQHWWDYWYCWHCMLRFVDVYLIIWYYWSLYVKIYSECNPKVFCVLTISNESPGIWWHWMLPMRSTGFYVKFYNVVLGSTMLLRTKFSAHHYFEDCRRHNVTVIQYIGELCRYLLAVPEVCFDVVL